MHEIFCRFYLFYYPFYLGRSSLLGLQTKTRRKSNSSFLSFKPHYLEMSMCSAVNVFVHAICKHSNKCLAQKVARFGSLGLIPMIQPPFNSSCVVLQYEHGTKFFHEWVWPRAPLNVTTITRFAQNCNREPCMALLCM